MQFLEVPSKHAEEIRKKLMELKQLSLEYPIIKEGQFVLFPITSTSIPFDYAIVQRDVDKRNIPPKALSEILGNLTITKSFDIIGDIAIIEIPDESIEKQVEIAQAVMLVNKKVKGVFRKLGAMEGEYRIRPLQYLFGENRSTTLYKENGIQLKLDISSVYFSVRLAHERKRISSVVTTENVMVFFAGVGPFALLIAKEHPNSKVIGIEINPQAVSFFKENVKLNSLSNVQVIQGDVATESKNFPSWADRIIMPLPKLSHEFLSSVEIVAKNNAIIHFYTIADSIDPLNSALKKLSSIKFELINWRIVRPYSSDLVQVVLDIRFIRSKFL